MLLKCLKGIYQRWKLKTINLRSTALEIAAVLSSLAYTILITYNSIWCWLFAFLSGSLFLVLCYEKKIFAEVALQGFYIFMAVYGYLNWGKGLSESPIPLGLKSHLIIIGTAGIIVFISGISLRNLSTSKLPYLDSFTTIFSMVATALMVLLYQENWLYWIVIDGVSIYLYYKRGLKISALLFVLYTLLAFNGYFQWGQLQ